MPEVESAPPAAVAPASRRGALEHLRETKRRMCACADRACTDGVRDELTAWVDRQIEAAGSATTMFAGADLRESEDLVRDTFACEDALHAKLPPEPAAPSPALATTALLAAAREQAQAQKPHLAAAAIEYRYARADGTLDPAYGELRVEFRAPPPGDDASRPVGAPVREHAPESADADCPTWTFTARTGAWEAELGACMPTVALAPRCTVAQVWHRAIAAGAPKDALATLAFSTAGWRFLIEDKPRRIEIVKTFADDCAPAATSP
ncbi:MAG: hypothetical protein KIT31_10175 [Deltaproteobacteria bacterium]|nr:hypothetical protein [Deltaproteobacteria bacterium]